jgi:hypothetical protein
MVENLLSLSKKMKNKKGKADGIRDNKGWKWIYSKLFWGTDWLYDGDGRSDPKRRQ